MKVCKLKFSNNPYLKQNSTAFPWNGIQEKDWILGTNSIIHTFITSVTTFLAFFLLPKHKWGFPPNSSLKSMADFESLNPDFYLIKNIFSSIAKAHL